MPNDLLSPDDGYILDHKTGQQRSSTQYSAQPPYASVQRKCSLMEASGKSSILTEPINSGDSRGMGGYSEPQRHRDCAHERWGISVDPLIFGVSICRSKGLGQSATATKPQLWPGRPQFGGAAVGWLQSSPQGPQL